MITAPPPPPDAGTVASDLAGSIGNQVITAALDIAPVAVPFVLALTALTWVLKKFGVGKKAGLGAVK